jgi:hypothetical protein
MGGWEHDYRANERENLRNRRSPDHSHLYHQGSQRGLHPRGGLDERNGYRRPGGTTGASHVLSLDPFYSLVDDIEENIQRSESQSGVTHKVKFGAAREYKKYKVWMTTSQKDAFLGWKENQDDVSTVQLQDHNNNTYYVEFLNKPRPVDLFNNLWECELELLEVLT